MGGKIFQKQVWTKAIHQLDASVRKKAGELPNRANNVVVVGKLEGSLYKSEERVPGHPGFGWFAIQDEVEAGVTGRVFLRAATKLMQEIVNDHRQTVVLRHRLACQIKPLGLARSADPLRFARACRSSLDS